MHINTDVIHKTTILKASLQRVWRAISDPKEFGDWSGLHVAGQFKPGEELHGEIVPTVANPEVAALQESHRGKKFTLTVEEVHPEKSLSFRWHPYAIDPNRDYSSEPTTLVVIAIEDAPGGVRFTVTESGFDALPEDRRLNAFEANGGGWQMMCGLIAKFVDDGE